MIQLVAPNLSAQGHIGYCLEYAGPKVFGTTYVPNPASAWQAWLETKSKHLDANLPADVCVPMWYEYHADLDGTGVKNWGHVTINVPGQGIYSSPWKTGTTFAVLSSITEVERIYGVKYVGWSEDILQEQVIKENDMASNSPVDETTTRLTYNLGLLRDANDAEVKASVNSGQTEEALLRGTLSSPEHQQVGADRDYGIKARSEGWEKKVADLTAANQKLVAQLQDCQSKPSLPADGDAVIVTKDNLWTSFKKFLGL